MGWGGGAGSEVMASGAYAFEWPEVKKILSAAWDLGAVSFCYITVLSGTGRRPGEIVGNFSKDRKAKAFFVTPEGKVDKTRFEYVQVPLPGLRPSDIDWERRMVRWCIEKRFRHKNTPGQFQTLERVSEVKEMPIAVLKVLWAYIKRNNIGPVERVFNFTPRTGWNIVRAAYKKSGVTGRKQLQKCFRHAYALHSLELSQKPEDMLALQTALSHKSWNTTAQYLKFGKRGVQNVRELVERMGDAATPERGPG